MQQLDLKGKPLVEGHRVVHTMSVSWFSTTCSINCALSKEALRTSPNVYIMARISLA